MIFGTIIVFKVGAGEGLDLSSPRGKGAHAVWTPTPKAITHVCNCLEILFPCSGPGHAGIGSKGNFYALSFKSNLLPDWSSEYSRSLGGE